MRLTEGGGNAVSTGTIFEVSKAFDRHILLAWLTERLTKLLVLALLLASAAWATTSFAQQIRDDTGQRLTIVTYIVSDGKGSLESLPASAFGPGNKCNLLSYKLCSSLFETINHRSPGAFEDAYCHRFSTPFVFKGGKCVQSTRR